MTTDERTTIRLNPYTVEVLDKAARLWPEFDSRSELIRKILADWDRIRNEGNGGGRMARIERLEARMTAMERRLEMTNDDTDHA